MFITPIKGLSDLSSIATSSSNKVTNTGNGSMFSQLLENAINQVNETEAVSKADSEALATGTIDDLHTVTINSAKAELALSLVVQIRNKALDAYNEIMRITL